MLTRLEQSLTWLLAAMRSKRRNGLLKIAFAAVVLAVVFAQFASAGFRQDNQIVSANTRLELIDWHISGLWVINSPVAWIKVTNYNSVPIHDITLEYETFTTAGKSLGKGTYTIEGTVAPHTTRNFIEQYLGLVDLYSERLQLRLLSVREGASSGHH